MRFVGIPRKVVVVLVLSAGLLATQSLPAGWGFAETWDIAKNIGVLEQSGDWGISMFDLAGRYPACVLGLDDDCDGFLDGGFFLGEKEKAEELFSTLPKEEIAFLAGGILTEKGWSGVTIIDPKTWQDMILLSYGEPPPGMIVNVPIVLTNREAAHPVISSLLLAVSQLCPVRYEWDFDYDGIVDKMGYWGNNKPVFLGPGIPPGGGQDTLRVVDNNSPAKTLSFIVGGSLPDTPGPGIIVIPNSNMGFKLNVAAIEGPGPGGGSNMGFKLNYFMWQGGEYEEPPGDGGGAMGTWRGKCTAWFMSSWAFLPEPSPVLASVRFAGTGVCDISAAFDGSLQPAVEIGDPSVVPLEDVQFTCSGNGKAAIFYARDGWVARPSSLAAQSARIDGAGAAAVILLAGEGWTVDAEIQLNSAKIYAQGGIGIGTINAVNWGFGNDAPWTWNYRTNTWEGLMLDAEVRESLFVRGEVNLDSFAGPDISDAIFILWWLFTGGPDPLCINAADVNDDGQTDISDAITLLSFLFTGGPPPEDPFPKAGPDPTSHSLGCDLMK